VDESEETEEEHIDVKQRMKKLYMEPPGIKIRPYEVKFGAVKIGSTFMKQLTIENNSSSEIQFLKANLGLDQSVCKFTMRYPFRESDTVVACIEPNQSFTFEVIAEPLMLGKTKELCMLHFKHFKIARDLIVTGLSGEEEVISKLSRPHVYGKPRYSVM